MINNNAEITKQLKEDFGLSELTGYPRRVSEAILPVVNVNDKISWKIGGLNDRTTTSTGVTIYTKPTGKRAFLTGIYLSNTQNAACDNTLLAILATSPQNPENTRLISKHKETTTAGSYSEIINFNTPMEINAVTFTCAFTAGTSTTSIILYGYLEDETGA